ncbi:hypothetical protein MTO96_026782 [Rhipicephalus appendiculatus]
MMRTLCRGRPIDAINATTLGEKRTVHVVTSPSTSDETTWKGYDRSVLRFELSATTIIDDITTVMQTDHLNLLKIK